MTRHFIIIFRSSYPEEDGSSLEKVYRTNAESHEEAVRSELSDYDIVCGEYVAFEVGQGFNSDEFHHDGVFDDIAEKLEEDGVGQLSETDIEVTKDSDIDRI